MLICELRYLVSVFPFQKTSLLIKPAQLCEFNTLMLCCRTKFLLWNVSYVFLCNFSVLNMFIMNCFVTVSVLSTMLEQSRVCFDWNWSRVCSPSGQSDRGAVCVGDGVASEHRPAQEVHLALLREWPAAGDIPDHRLGFRSTVSFNASMCLIHMPCWIRWT